MTLFLSLPFGDAYDTSSRQPFTFGARRLTLVARKPV